MTEEYVFCNVCGGQNKHGSIFCSTCGEKVSHIIPTRKEEIPIPPPPPKPENEKEEESLESTNVLKYGTLAMIISGYLTIVLDIVVAFYFPYLLILFFIIDLIILVISIYYIKIESQNTKGLLHALVISAIGLLLVVILILPLIVEGKHFYDNLLIL